MSPCKSAESVRFVEQAGVVRNQRKTVFAVLLLVAVANAQLHEYEPGTGILLLWPSARSISLAGAMTGLADETDATFFNPAGLAFRNRIGFNLNYGNCLPGLYPGMHYANGSFATPVRSRLGPFHNLNLGADVTWLYLGETEVINERGEYLGRHSVWRAVAGICAGVLVRPNLGVGIGLKLLRIRTFISDYWELWIVQDDGGNATAVSGDLSLLWRSSDWLSVGAALSNLGPRISYRYWSRQDMSAASQPTTVRLGLSLTPIRTGLLRLTVLPEVTDVLPSAIRPWEEPKPWCLQNELNGLWKSLGVELSISDIVSLRAGYFEDLVRDRGGVVVERNGMYHHISLWEFFTRKRLGSFKRIGVCWGFGLGYQDMVRLDVSNDGAIYDWPESNWRFSLVCNDPAGLARRLRRLTN